MAIGIPQLVSVTEKLLTEQQRTREDAVTAEKRKIRDLQKQYKEGDKRTREIKDIKLELDRMKEDAQQNAKASAETKDATVKLLGISNKEFEQRRGMVQHIANQRATLEALAKSIEEQGGVAEENKNFIKLSTDLQREEIALRRRTATSPSKRAELDEERRNLDKKNSFLLRTISKGITGMKDKMFEKVKGAGRSIWAVLKGTMLAGFLVALLAFLDSDTWKRMQENIVEFVKNPSLSNFFAIFAPAGKWSIIAAVGGLALLFGPVRTAMAVGGLLYTGIKGFTGMFLKGGLIQRGLAGLTDLVRRTFGPKKPPILPKTGLPGTGADKEGQTRKPGKAGKGPGGKFAKVGAGLLRGAAGAARFLGPIGLAITAVMGVVDGVRAGMEEAQKENSTNLTIMREASAGVISGLTFGLISQDTISKAFLSVGCKFDEMSAGVVKVTQKAWQGVKDLIPTEEKLKEKFTTLKNDLSPLTEIKLPTEFSPAAIQESVTSLACALNASFENITGININDELSNIKNSVTDKAAALVCSFENITGIDVNATLTSIKTGVADTAKRLTSSFENITGLTVPKSFTEAKDLAAKTLEDVGCLVSDKFTELTGLTMPTFGDIENKLSDLGTRISGSFTDLWNIELPSFAEIGTKLEGLLPDMSNPLQSLSNALRKSASDKGVLDWWPMRQGARAISDVIDSLIPRNQQLKEGGSIKGGYPYLVGEMGPELIIPTGSGQVFNANRTEQILASGIDRSTQGMGGGTSLVNAPVTSVQNNQTSTTFTKTSLTHPSPLLNAVNAAA